MLAEKNLLQHQRVRGLLCTIVDGRVISGICQHGINFPFVEIESRSLPSGIGTYKEYVDHLKEITPKENQI